MEGCFELGRYLVAFTCLRAIEVRSRRPTFPSFKFDFTSRQRHGTKPPINTDMILRHRGLPRQIRPRWSLLTTPAVRLQTSDLQWRQASGATAVTAPHSATLRSTYTPIAQLNETSSERSTVSNDRSHESAENTEAFYNYYLQAKARHVAQIPCAWLHTLNVEKCIAPGPGP